MPNPPFDPATGHRWFAVELNNAAWPLVEADTRTDAQTQRMLHAAHGACFHWCEVGDPIHHLRALCLLTAAYLAAGDAETAVDYAERAMTLTEPAGDAVTPFDRACVHGGAALAYTRTGDEPAARAHRDALQTACATLGDDDLAVIDPLYRRPLGDVPNA